MGRKLRFDTYKDMLSFLDFVPDFLSWGCRTFYLNSNSNAAMNINTYTGNEFSDGYIPFNNVRTYINPYYEANKDFGGIVCTIKLVCPSSYRQSVDPTGCYNNFFIDFYASDNVCYANCCYEEITNELLEQPFYTFCAYIEKFYKKWALYDNATNYANIEHT